MKQLLCINVVILIVFLKVASAKSSCPQLCECDILDSFKRAACVNQNIIDVNLGVPKYVQIYDLSHNSIKKLDDYTFKNLGYNDLIELNLSHNTISWIGLHAFFALNNIEILNLSNNAIQGIPHDLFINNKKLKSLDLSGNKLLTFPNEPFITHINLKMLSLRHSKISSIPENAFKGLMNLTLLDISENYMITLNKAVIQPLSNLKTIILDKNSWHCNRIYYDLQDWLTKNKINYVKQCKSISKDEPNKLEKLILLDLPTIPEENDSNNPWNIPEESNEELIKSTDEKPMIDERMTFLKMYNQNVPSIVSLAVGLLVGKLLGIIGTYCWLSQMLKCKKVKMSRRNGNIIRYNRPDGRDRLLLNSSMRENFVTPPTTRRQVSDSSTICTRSSWEARGFNNVNSRQQTNTNLLSECNDSSPSILNCRSDTPPPPYNDVLNDIVLARN